MSARQVVIGALFVDSGLVPDPASEDGRLRRVRPPRARYACYLCRAQLGPVHGPTDVAAFVADASISHRATCPANQQGATAA